MNPLWTTLRRIISDLSERGHGFALVGGLATSALTEPRFTRDVDLAVTVADDAAAESLVRSLLASGYHASAVLEQESTGRLATVRLLPPEAIAGGAVVDLLFASCGIEPEIVRDAEVTTLAEGLRLPVARCGHLIAMKLLAVNASRPQDRIDLIRLIERANTEELERARNAIHDIEARGFARGRQLATDLDELLQSQTRGPE